MNRIREIRKAQGLTLVELSKRAGIDPKNLSEMERGLGPNGPSLRTLHTLAAALDVSAGDLIEAR